MDISQETLRAPSAADLKDPRDPGASGRRASSGCTSPRTACATPSPHSCSSRARAPPMCTTSSATRAFRSPSTPRPPMAFDGQARTPSIASSGRPRRCAASGPALPPWVFCTSGHATGHYHRRQGARAHLAMTRSPARVAANGVCGGTGATESLHSCLNVLSGRARSENRSMKESSGSLPCRFPQAPRARGGWRPRAAISSRVGPVGPADRFTRLRVSRSSASRPLPSTVRSVPRRSPFPGRGVTSGDP